MITACHLSGGKGIIYCGWGRCLGPKTQVREETIYVEKTVFMNVRKPQKLGCLIALRLSGMWWKRSREAKTPLSWDP